MEDGSFCHFSYEMLFIILLFLVELVVKVKKQNKLALLNIGLFVPGLSILQPACMETA